jgi:BirA family transcriptional regulator, biotin operon repressor / biotin---[acetyl-CoA-carboxylase] ligase
MYSNEELQSGLSTQIFGKKIFIFDSIDSTNAYAKTLASTSAEEGTIVIAEYQTTGHGRLGRTWRAESGSNILFSIIIRPTIEINKVGLLPFFAAVGVALAVETITGTCCECKWPNDVLLNGKKCCGILLESSFQHNVLDYAVIGIGVNVNQKVFDEDLKDRATSLIQEYGKKFDRKSVLHHILTSLELLYSEVKVGSFETILKEWNARTTMFGKQVTLTQAGEQIHGRAISLSMDGGLVLATPAGQRVCYAGDVTFALEE